MRTSLYGMVVVEREDGEKRTERKTLGSPVGYFGARSGVSYLAGARRVDIQRNTFVACMYHDPSLQ